MNFLHVKMRHRIYLWLFFFIALGSKAQNNIDSLQLLLESSEDTIRVKVLNQLSKLRTHTDPAVSLKYAMQAKQLSEEINNPYLLAKSINNVGMSYYYLNELELSNENYLAALNLFDSLGYKPGMARALNNIAWNYKYQKLGRESIKYFLQALGLAREVGDKNLEQGILNNLGTVYRQIGEMKKALDNYKQSLELNRKSGNKRWEAYNLSNIAMVYFDTTLYDLAIKYYHQAIEINKGSQFTEELANNYINIGGVYIEKNEYSTAESYFQEADSIIEKKGFKRSKLLYLEYLSRLNKAQGDFKEALDHTKQYYELSTQLNKLAWNEKLAEMQTKYDISQKKRELKNAERQLLQQRFIILGGSSVFLLLVAILILIVSLYRSKNKWAKNIELLNAEVNQKNEKLIDVNEQMRLMNNALETTVNERTAKISLQNEKLIKYAFINSHEIRGPLARVLGLIYLINLENSKLKEDKNFVLLNEATRELDDIIKQTSKILEDEGLL